MTSDNHTEAAAVFATDIQQLIQETVGAANSVTVDLIPGGFEVMVDFGGNPNVNDTALGTFD